MNLRASQFRSLNLNARICVMFLGLGLLIGAGSPAVAQIELDLPGQQDFGLEQDQQEPVELSATFEIFKDSREGRLSVTAMIAEKWYIYSITQPKGGPKGMKLKVAESKNYLLTGKFQPDADPVIVPPNTGDNAFDVPAEKHTELVTWTAPVTVAEGVDLDTLEIKIDVTGQVCKEACQDVEETITASFAGFVDKPKTGSFRPPNSHVEFEVWVEPQVIKPGGKAKLFVRARPESPYHIYPLAEHLTTESANKPTLIALTKKSPFACFQTKLIEGINNGEYIEGESVWQIELQAPVNTDPEKHIVAGLVGFQVCTETGCDQPDAIEFEVPIEIGPEQVEGRVDATIRSAISYSQVETAAEKYNSQISSSGSRSIWYYLGIAFLAGLILNIMPCVLPVIGLKIMGFVQQAGDKPGKIFMLNAVFAFGMLTVFWALALLAVSVSGFSWGMQFESNAFKISMIAIVFAFGLSFLGVWEIPIPGFVGSGKTGKLAEKEGIMGAFFKGVLTTLLATPCSGPMLGPAVGWAIAQPAWLTFAVFTSLGLGMASPYILIGLFPRLMRMLPKPGAWMETFKQIMGFVLMGTVVFLFNSVELKYVVSVLSLLVGIAFACWLVGRVSLAAELPKKLRAWATAGGIIVATYFFAFYVIISPFELPWQEFSNARLQQERDRGRIVFIDFTADW